MELRDYQKSISSKAANTLMNSNIVYLAMECRTGKSITAYETVKKCGFETLLVVSKKKAIVGLENDYVHYKDHFSMTIINYESIHKVDGDFDCVIVDEAHGLGAFPKPSKRTKSLKAKVANLPIIYLSATPTPESWSQIYHQFFISSFSPFKGYGNFYKWANKYVNVTTDYRSGRPVNNYTDANISSIKQQTDHLFINFTQSESGFDVKIDEKVLYLPLNKTQKSVIKRLKDDKIVVGSNGGVIIADTAVKMQQKIHQICSGTVKLEDGSRIVLCKDKPEFIKNYFKGKKIAIFYKFIAEFDALKSVFPNWTSDQNEFQESKDKVYLGQFVSSREGVRLDTADSLVFMNIDFSYLSYAQARERIISKERIKTACLYWIFTDAGIEKKIYKAVLSKEDYTVQHFKRDYNAIGKTSSAGN